eukprot:GHVT01061229.1.p1 GENE.GHVT01061229.1~~GHVT01061229.1.p1  ORF type:complete len:600 (-),score=136.36 GHVT01061229.1:772-2352(-)
MTSGSAIVGAQQSVTKAISAAMRRGDFVPKLLHAPDSREWFVCGAGSKGEPVGIVSFSANDCGSEEAAERRARNILAKAKANYRRDTAAAAPHNDMRPAPARGSTAVAAAGAASNSTQETGNAFFAPFEGPKAAALKGANQHADNRNSEQLKPPSWIEGAFHAPTGRSLQGGKFPDRKSDLKDTFLCCIHEPKTDAWQVQYRQKFNQMSRVLVSWTFDRNGKGNDLFSSFSTATPATAAAELAPPASSSSASLGSSLSTPLSSSFSSGSSASSPPSSASAISSCGMSSAASFPFGESSSSSSSSPLSIGSFPNLCQSSTSLSIPASSSATSSPSPSSSSCSSCSSSPSSSPSCSSSSCGSWSSCGSSLPPPCSEVSQPVSVEMLLQGCLALLSRWREMLKMARVARHDVDARAAEVMTSNHRQKDGHVVYDKPLGRWVAVLYINRGPGRRQRTRCRTFSIKKYGFLEAKFLALAVLPESRRSQTSNGKPTTNEAAANKHPFTSLSHNDTSLLTPTLLQHTSNSNPL